MSQGLLYQGHNWYHCSGCCNPTVGRCCGPLQPWRTDDHGHLPTAIQRAHRSGHQFGYTPGYGGYNNSNDFLGTLLVLDGIADGDAEEVMLGSMMGGGLGGGIAEVLVVEELLDDDRDDRRYGDDDDDGFDLF